MEIASMFVLMAHVLCLVLAAIGVAFAELSLFGQAHVDRRLLDMAARMVAWALAALWLSGLTLIWIDTRFDLALIAAKPKLMAKLSVVSVLTLNGVLLHRRFFSTIGVVARNPNAAANVITLLATLSGASWLYAGFLGLAKALAPLLSLTDFLLLYLLALGVGGLFCARFVRPRLLLLHKRMAPHGQRGGSRHGHGERADCTDGTPGTDSADSTDSADITNNRMAPTSPAARF